MILSDTETLLKVSFCLQILQWWISHCSYCFIKCYFYTLSAIVLCAGKAQHCQKNATLSVPFGSVSIGVVNTTAPFCFICGGNVATFSLAGVMLTNTEDYFIDMSIDALVINNWTSLMFNANRAISVECVSTGTPITYSGTFFSECELK